MNKNRIIFLVGALFLIGMIASTGCASKKYVLGEVATLDQKVEGMEIAVEENQKRIKEHDERLTTLGSLITQHESTLDQQKSELDGKINEVRRFAQGKLILQEVIRNDEARFAFESFELSDEAKVALDKLVEKLIAQNKGLYLEIQGHADSTGPEDWNVYLGKKRGEAVMEYLHEKYHIPLHRMEVISYGSAKPMADNSTREGRAQNRRVVILVYE
ncbi:MAG: OmpA family protein [Candidatus Aminicenantes bacterium]|nr:OmpA family protein [Candidatus Aminicenantes bacterium]